MQAQTQEKIRVNRATQMKTQVQMLAQETKHFVCNCVAPVHTYFYLRLRLHLHLRLRRTCKPGSTEMQAQTQAREA